MDNKDFWGVGLVQQDHQQHQPRRSSFLASLREEDLDLSNSKLQVQSPNPFQALSQNRLFDGANLFQISASPSSLCRADIHAYSVPIEKELQSFRVAGGNYMNPHRLVLAVHDESEMSEKRQLNTGKQPSTYCLRGNGFEEANPEGLRLLSREADFSSVPYSSIAEEFKSPVTNAAISTVNADDFENIFPSSRDISDSHIHSNHLSSVGMHSSDLRMKDLVSTPDGFTSQQKPANYRLYDKFDSRTKDVDTLIESADGFIYKIQFKCLHRYFILGASAPHGIKAGDFVKVDADRGEDLGIVCGKISCSDFKEEKPTAGFRGRGFSVIQEGNKRLVRLATSDERAQLQQKTIEEIKTLQVCRDKVLSRGLPMEIRDAEYQFDRHKLTFYFEADKRIDFRELVSDLFALYKTRIWMQQIDTSFKPDQEIARLLRSGQTNTDYFAKISDNRLFSSPLGASFTGFRRDKSVQDSAVPEMTMGDSTSYHFGSISRAFTPLESVQHLLSEHVPESKALKLTTDEEAYEFFPSYGNPWNR